LNFIQSFEKYSNAKYDENPSSGSRVVPYGRMDEQTVMTKLLVTFRNFAKAPKNVSKEAAASDLFYSGGSKLLQNVVIHLPTKSCHIPEVIIVRDIMTNEVWKLQLNHLTVGSHYNKPFYKFFYAALFHYTSSALQE
jgi:hypothetical protein